MKIVIAGGGTGGHLYPALALAELLYNKANTIFYIGANGKMDEKVTKSLPYQKLFLSVVGANHIVPFIISQSQSYLLIKKYLKKIKPSIVIGFGGYVSLATVFAAWRLKIPTIIHEQNVALGKSNRVLVPLVNAVAVSFFETTKKLPKEKSYFIGNPRSSLFRRNNLKKVNNFPKVLFVMGSLGSRSVLSIIKEYLPFKTADYHVLIITGEKNFAEFQSLKEVNKGIDIIPFSNHINDILQTTDLVISRSGATILAELSVMGIPAILIPSPYVSENHQMVNAQLFKTYNAAEIIEEKDLTPYILNETISKLIKDAYRLKQMRLGMLRLAAPEALSQMVSLVERVANQ